MNIYRYMLLVSAWLISAGNVLAAPVEQNKSAEPCSPVLDYRFKRLNADQYDRLCERFNGKLVLVVNTASKCAFTPQYDGLEKLYRRYKNSGLVVVGFPSNDFAGQEPGTEAQIQDFCRLTYNVEFPMYEKVSVKQGSAAAFYQQLAALANGEYPRWNFHKYLIAPNGELIASIKSHVRPQDERFVRLIRENLPQ
ncbi:MAG: glutathione peroxidase [Alphaproteobacteria bacterium]